MVNVNDKVFGKRKVLGFAIWWIKVSTNNLWQLPFQLRLLLRIYIPYYTQLVHLRFYFGLGITQTMIEILKFYFLEFIIECCYVFAV